MWKTAQGAWRFPSCIRTLPTSASAVFRPNGPRAGRTDTLRLSPSMNPIRHSQTRFDAAAQGHHHWCQRRRHAPDARHAGSDVTSPAFEQVFDSECGGGAGRVHFRDGAVTGREAVPSERVEQRLGGRREASHRQTRPSGLGLALGRSRDSLTSQVVPSGPVAESRDDPSPSDVVRGFVLLNLAAAGGFERPRLFSAANLARLISIETIVCVGLGLRLGDGLSRIYSKIASPATLAARFDSKAARRVRVQSVESRQWPSTPSARASRSSGPF